MSKRADQQREVRREKNTTYYVVFIPLGSAGSTEIDYQAIEECEWAVLIPGDPAAHPELIFDAKAGLQERHRVSSWRQIADGYTIHSR